MNVTRMTDAVVTTIAGMRNQLADAVAEVRLLTRTEEEESPASSTVTTAAISRMTRRLDYGAA